MKEKMITKKVPDGLVQKAPFNNLVNNFYQPIENEFT